MRKNSRNPRKCIVSLAIMLALGAGVARAQYYKIHDFDHQDGPTPPVQTGTVPRAALILASDGNFYGTASESSSTGGQYGTFFRMNRFFEVKALADIHDSSGGAYPHAPLIESQGRGFGYLYGTSVQIDGDEGGVVFRTDFLGNMSLFAFADFPVDDSVGLPGLTEAFGYYYGVSGYYPAIFRVDKLGNVEIVHQWFNGVDNFTGPAGGLTLASDGYLYGTTLRTGVYGLGTVFRLDSQGNITTLHDFGAAPDGAEPSGRLIESNGWLYGTTFSGGGLGLGTIYRINLSGLHQNLHNFTGSDGWGPTGSLVEMRGAFFGTTYRGGQYSQGTLFQMDSSANVTVLHEFGAAGDGSIPVPLLAVPRNPQCIACHDYLYGATEGGGIHDYGTLFLFEFDARVSIINLFPTEGPVFVPPGVSVKFRGKFQVGLPAFLTIGGLPATNVEVLDEETLQALTPVDLQPGLLHDVTVTTAAGEMATLEGAWMSEFLDQPVGDANNVFVERVFRARLMEGCGEGNFCPAGTIDRGAFAVMALKAKHGPAWAPPTCTGQFRDVRCPGPEADWIEAAVAEGIVEGCTTRRFCPNEPIRRETLPEMMLKTAHGADYEPPPCTGIFRDVRCPSKFADGIEQLYREGVVEACSTSPLRYCPNPNVDRVSMARFAVRAFRLS